MQRLVVLLALAAVAVLGGRVSVSALDDSGDAAGTERGRLVAVVDGDTLKVRVGGRRESVRLIGIDTPETHRPGTPVECGGPQATAAMKRRVRRGDGVTLVPDGSQDRRDRYGRLLAYVEQGGADLGRAQVRAGWADVYVYDDVPFARLASYRAAARRARGERLGVNARCGGDFHRPQ